MPETTLVYVASSDESAVSREDDGDSDSIPDLEDPSDSDSEEDCSCPCHARTKPSKQPQRPSEQKRAVSVREPQYSALIAKSREMWLAPGLPRLHPQERYATMDYIFDAVRTTDEKSKLSRSSPSSCVYGAVFSQPLGSGEVRVDGEAPERFWASAAPGDDQVEVQPSVLFDTTCSWGEARPAALKAKL